ncbi:ABC transporter ATP-binding protein [Tropicimonas sp. TH_r6]|uniref:ABC transporter ATP-binding protein n=1 Tax=Tropicimonas sp. TH_r6 TaxID=3082085 RepID=UPI002954AB04|nr:ABC transporter ATP-binding protein [Tropicimonas sp. TH_r6]MDV7143755.1 ABC transporter ATP-binding protein [Tropicimonas sp. TH_r6]
MAGLYERVTRFFLNVFDPYDLSDATPHSEIWPYLRAHMWPMRRILLASVLVTALAASVEVWLIQYAGKVVDILASTSPEHLWKEQGKNLLLAGLVVLLLRPFAQFLRLAINDISFSCNVANLVRWRAFDHLIRQSVGWFQEDLSGRTSGRLVDIGNHVSDAIHSALNTVAYGLVYMIGVVVLMAGTEIWLALPLLLWLGLYMVVLIRVMPRMVDAQHDFQSAKSALYGTVVDGFSNFDTLKLFAPRDQIAREQHASLEATRQALFRTRQIGIALRTTLIMLEAIVMVGFVGYGIWLWSTEAASIGLVSSAIALSLRITTMADWVLDSIWWLFMRIGSLREALQTIGQPIAIPNESDVELVVGDGVIEIEDLHHHYGLGAGGLDGISLTIRPGEKIGLVGRSGSGKSTLVNLLLRFFEAEEGRIRIDGQDIREVDQDSLRAAIGMVAQQAALLNRSVKDNILLGRTDVSDEMLKAVTTKARAHDFITGLRDNKGRAGYDAHVGERGVKLSGGQRQRVALARVILKDAPILILDEATSALDSEVETEIQHSLIEVMQDKTVIAIAHRLSTIARMDRIIVMDRGRIVEQGTHEELKSRSGLYASFWSRQSDGFIDTTD